ncbi:hypothetical protein Ahy_A04g020164 [Arachis hypogaea]|uniref:Uncharacterized protein n=1 Tax=Arachis hypogaea TaxID=3818 RepID=A0A445DH59_ARAHY|nr:hypothetical protein Ahy_A04g020164 [Arachis hypogaea]
METSQFSIAALPMSSYSNALLPSPSSTAATASPSVAVMFLRAGFHLISEDCPVITLYLKYPVDPCDITGGSSGPAIHHGLKPELRISFFYARLQIQERQSCDSSNAPSRMSLHHRLFAPNPNTCTQKISVVIKLMYNHLWLTYTQIPAETRDRWFQKWALKFIWDAEYNLMIKKIYYHRVAKHFQQMMRDVRKGHDHLTSWIHQAIKKELEAYFTHDEGASPRSSKYKGVSATFMKTKSRLSKSLDHERHWRRPSSIPIF